jgi:hypothetical protein
MLDQNPSCLGQSRAMASAVKQQQALHILKRPYGLADSRLHATKFSTGSGKAPRIGDRYQNT